MKKNDKIEVLIETLTGEGTGIGRVNGLTVFVPNTAAGDKIIAHIIKVKKNYAIGKLQEILESSDDRKEVDCPAFKSCGGCAFRHITYEKELKTKQNGVESAIRRIGGIDLSPKDIIPSPKITRYRNKAQYPVALGKDGISYGFFARHSHRVIESNGCMLQPVIFEQVMQTVKAWADENKITVYNSETKCGLLRHVLLRIGEKTGEIMVVPVINGDSLPKSDDLVQKLKSALGENFVSLSYNINKNDTNVVLGEKIINVYGKATITDILCGVTLEISPHSFYQVNREAAELLYKEGARYIDANDKVILDLYCGIGSIGLSVLNILQNKNTELYGVEIIPSAIENAKHNAKINGFTNAHFFCGDALKASIMLKEKNIKPDAVILDPPRKGCEPKLIELIANNFAPKKIVYISCDPATLARDVKYFNELGYSLVEYTPVDMFPGTSHVESVVLLTKTHN